MEKERLGLPLNVASIMSCFALSNYNSIEKRKKKKKSSETSGNMIYISTAIANSVKTINDNVRHFLMEFLVEFLSQVYD